MAVETQYNIVKVNELREITVAMGNDEIIINDLDSSPLETKKITAENLALSIKDYILPIATDTVLGGVKIGHGLTINPITGVLSNDINILDDLQDVIILNPEVGHVIRYNGVQWINQPEGGITEVVAGEGLSGGGTEGVLTLNVNAGPGLRIENDQVTVNAGGGLAIESDYLVVQLAPGLTLSSNLVTLVLGPGLMIQNGSLNPNLGAGLRIEGDKIVTDLGSGLTYDGNKNIIHRGKGLTINNLDQLEVLIGAGLKFTGNVLEGSSVLNDLNDVVIDNPQQDQIVKYDSGSSTWQNGQLKLDNLSDVTISSPEEKEALVYNGTRWENAVVRGVNDAVYKKIHNCRISLESDKATPIHTGTDASSWTARTQVTSTQIYLHPYRGSEVGLWDPQQQIWYLAHIDGVVSSSLAECANPNSVYDVYIYNNGTVDVPILRFNFVPWLNEITPPTRSLKDGITVKQGSDTHRWMGAVRTTSGGTSGYDLGGLIPAAERYSTPFCYIANCESTVQVTLQYVFGSAFEGVSRPPGAAGWGCPNSYSGGTRLDGHPQINFLNVTDEMVHMEHNHSTEGGYYSASNLGIDLPDAVIINNNPSNQSYYSAFSLWMPFTRHSSNASAGLGSHMNMPMYHGKHRITYWWDSCGGVYQNARLGFGFSITYSC